MPKKKNAYAFRSYDGTRILQRPFFKSLKLPAGTDAEILSALKAADSDSLDVMEEKVQELGEVAFLVASYQRHLKRHGDRLRKYTQAVANKIAADDDVDMSELRARYKRANELSMRYCGCVSGVNGTTTFYLGGITVDDVGGLIQKIAERYKELAEKVKVQYRKIFATRLKQARKEMKLTQSGLATKLKLSQRAVGSYENAENEPSIAMLIRISKELKRPIDWLVGAI